MAVTQQMVTYNMIRRMYLSFDCIYLPYVRWRLNRG